MKEFKALSKRIDEFRDEMVDWQIQLTAIPALSPVSGGEGEAEKAELIKKLLKETGLTEIQELKAPDLDVPSGYRPNLLAFYRGKSTKKTIWIMTHMDIVPPGELSLWKGDPYKAWVEGGKLYGRGVEDNQQEMVSSIFALKAFMAEGILPNYDVGFAIVADEETGSGKGIEHVLNNTDVFRQQDLIIVPDAGNEDGTMIEIAEKGILWLKFHTKGQQTHGSTPHKGINSFRSASYLVTELDKLYQIYDYKDTLFDPPYSTFEPTKKESNVPNINTIPGDDVFYLDSRVMPKYSFEEVEKKISEMSKVIEDKFKVKIEIEDKQRAPAAPPTPAEAEVVQSLKRAIKAVYNKEAKPMGVGGGTVAAFFRRAGFNAAVWAKIDETAHQPNEYCIIDNMVGDGKVYAHIFLQE